MSSTKPKHLEDPSRPSQKAEPIDRLADGVAQEFNDLLTVINSYAEMLLAGGEFSGEAAEWLKQIYLAGERAATLTRQLLAASQPSVPMPVTDLNAIVTGGKEVVLVVEDEESVRALAVMILRKQGYRVLEAASGAEALEVWERHHTRIDALITDMVMPGDMTGRELATQLQRQKRSLKIVFTTGYSADLMGDEPAGPPRPSLLEKPYLPRQLARALRTALDSYEPSH